MTGQAGWSKRSVYRPEKSLLFFIALWKRKMKHQAVFRRAGGGKLHTERKAEWSSRLCNQSRELASVSTLSANVQIKCTSQVVL